MFGSWALTTPRGPGLSENLSIKKHTGPLTFPPPPAPAPVEPPPDLAAFFSPIRRATDVTPAHLTALNVSVTENVPLEGLVGDARFIPSVDTDAVWAERTRELSLENSVAFEVLARTRRDVKLGHMYRFFQAVELLDPYYEAEPSIASPPTPMDLDPPASSVTNTNEHGKRPASQPAPPDPAAEKPDFDFAVPERFREDLIQNFLDPLTWSHRLRTAIPRAPPRVGLKNLLFQAHLTHYLLLTPINPQQARQGIFYGPIMATQVRHEHTFRIVADPAALFLRRRKAALAAAASAAPPPPEKRNSKKARREREKAAEKAAGEADDDPLSLSGSGILFPTNNGQGADVVGSIREVVALVHIAQLRHRQDGEKVGGITIRALDGAEEVEVALMRGMHHHISISVATVTKKYLERLREGKSMGDEVLKVRRSKWWSLLVPKERVEAAKAVWAVMTKRKEEEEARESARKEKEKWKEES